jgi:Arm DNA-binding domain/Phage integrase family
MGSDQSAGEARMPKAKLTTNAAVNAIPNPEQGQSIYYCTELQGFGVLAGARQKTFILERRVNGNTRRVTIGRVGEITLQKARQDAEQLIGEMAGGTDPVARKRDQTAGGMTLREAWELHQQAMTKKGNSQATFDDYESKIDCHMSDWLDRPLVEITRPVCNARHLKIGENNGTYMANGVMRVLRAVWRRARRQHPELPEVPTMNVDFYPEEGRTAVITDWVSWWNGVQQIVNPVRRGFYIWLAFSGCRAGESMSMEVKNLDLDKGIVRYPTTKTKAFEMPLSDFQIELLQDLIEHNAEDFGADCRWVFPSMTSESGHLEEEKLIASEPKLFKEHWSPHTLRHSWITTADQKVKISDAHQRALTNHKPKRAKSSDAHQGYIHPDLDDLRKSQQLMTNYLLAQIKPKPGRGKKRGGNVVPFKKTGTTG